MGFVALLVATAAPAQEASTSDLSPPAAASSAAERPTIAPLLPDLTPIPDPDAPAQLSSAAADGAVGPAVSTLDFVRMAVILAAVVGAIYLIFFLIRRGTAARVNENDMIRLLGSRTLGGNRNLHLVKVGANVYLVGAADEAVNLVAEVTDKESLDSIQLEDAAALTGGARRSFGDVLGELFQTARRVSGSATSPPTGTAAGRASSTAAEAGTFLARQRQRLEQTRASAAGDRT